jgi:16S rRNA (uracil1498-N3)-methyltransferase
VNLILLFDGDFLDATRVRLTSRRFAHIRDVHRASAGEQLVVGVANGRLGQGTITSLGPEALEMDIVLDREPPPPLPLTLILALPRPKVLNRVIAGAASLGIKHVVLMNAWRVEKSYWSSPRLAGENLRAQSILGLEQARDTVLPSIETRRLFRPFVEDELPSLIRGTRSLVAHPRAPEPCPRNVREPVTLVIGPEGGFIEAEIASLKQAGCKTVAIGERILRVETAVPFLAARLF